MRLSLRRPASSLTIPECLTIAAMDKSEASAGSTEQATSQSMEEPKPSQVAGLLDNKSTEENKDQEDDSDSDISMSGSDDDELGFQTGRTKSATVTELGIDTTGPSSGAAVESRKRKLPGTATEASISSEPSKKVKVDKHDPLNATEPSPVPSDRSFLPAAIWHHIFTFTPPRTLGKLVRVNKLFSSYLDPSFSLQCSPPQPPTKSCVFYLRPEVIWQASRRRFCARWMPKPLRDRSELDMWRLTCLKKCQFCGKSSGGDALLPNDKTHPGPGVEGVKTIWPFAVRSCGPCLISNSVKEIDLLLSSTTPSFLLPALSFVLITNDMHVFTSGALWDGQIPGDVQFTKFFLAKQVEELKGEFVQVKSMGTATTEEWVKGLEDRGKSQRIDSARWEKWEAAGGISQMKALRSPGESTETVVKSCIASNTAPVPTSSNVSSRSASSAMHLPDGSYDSVSKNHPSKFRTDPIVSLSFCSEFKGRYLGFRYACSPVNADDEPFSRPQSSTQPGQQPRLRTREEVDEMKAARRAEIERRALLLDPPLPPNVLAHIPSFQAATQIIHPLDDKAWELLKPRLLAQRADAEQREQREQELIAHSRIVHERSEERRNLDAIGRESKELIDKDWDDAQAPLRAQICAYADEIVRDGWDGGRKVKKDSAPRFAVEVLLYVRGRFYAEVAKVATAARAAGQEPLRDPPGGPFTQKLTLENMKWLFDTKIKPHTESFGKELFLCNGCDGNGKVYGFEGVIQHYAAKHTSTLSLGSVVVHWRSEWPEKPPFQPNPHSQAVSAGRPNEDSLAPNATNRHYSYNAHPVRPHHHQQQTPYAVAPPATYGAPVYPNQYGAPPPNHGGYGSQGLYPPPQNFYGQYPPQPAPYAPPYNPHPNEYAAPPPALPHYPPQVGGVVSGPGSIAPATSPYSQNHGAYQSNGHVGYGYQDKVRAQHEDISHNSREVWMILSGLKDLPGNIRVYVVLHHLAKRYRSRFSESPSLRMFIEGLSNNKDMRPVRNVNGLMCKACQTGLGNGNQAGEERSTFSLPQLVNHFQQRHIEPLEVMGAPLLDWTIDMVFVSDLSSLSNLRSMSGMDPQKYALITETFPQMPPSTPYQHRGMPGNYYGGRSRNSLGHEESKKSAVAETGSVRRVPSPMEYQPPRHDEPPPTVDEYDPHQPALSNATLHTLSAALQQAQVELIPSSVVYAPARASQAFKPHGGSGSDSPDVRQPPEKTRKRKTSSKDRRPTSDRSNKHRKGSIKPSMDASAKFSGRDASDEEDKIAEEEAQRQEEAIRAMWAADRRETARLYTAPQTNQDADASPHKRTQNTRQMSQTPEPRQIPRPHVAQEDRPSPLLAPRSVIPDQDDDLFAGLESHLNQQSVTSTATQSSRPINPEGYEPEPVYKPRSVHEREPAYERRVDLRRDTQYTESPRFAYDVGRPRSPVRMKHEAREPLEGYRVHSPVAYPVESPYSRPSRAPEHIQPVYSTRPVSVVYDEDFGQPYPEDYYRIRSDEARAHPPPEAASYSHTYAEDRRARPIQYTEAYELIRMRDSQGEYYIRRPVKRDPGPVYTAYDDKRYERPVYRQAERYESYDQPYYSRESVYEPAYRPEPSSRPPVFEMRSRSDSAARQPVFKDAGSCEEYDPRFPAAPPTGTPRHTRYQ